ncbi:MAG: hypothetical protein QM689_12050 [Oscillospiraceae bacterium]
MMIPYTLLQKILIAVALILFAACAVGDMVLLSGELAGGKNGVTLNLLLCLLLGGVFAFLIRRPQSVERVDEDDDKDAVPLLTATRTYLCFLALDASAVLTIVLYGEFALRSPVVTLLLVSVMIFAAGAVKYLIDTRRIGFAEDEPAAEPDTEAEVLAEEAAPTPEQPVLSPKAEPVPSEKASAPKAEEVLPEALPADAPAAYDQTEKIEV